MSGLAVFLIAVGLADALRRLTRPLWPALTLAPVAVVVTALLAGLWHFGDIPLLVIAAAASIGWLLLCARAERTGRHEPAALVLFAAAVGALILLSGWGSAVGGLIARWPHWAGRDGVDPDRLLMVAGVVLLQLVTGNQLVRLVLGSVGAVKPAGEPQPSDRLKGGRLLGPMERLLILGLGLGGQLAAATAVVAAKSIIRFPEINAQKDRKNGGATSTVGIDDVTEYFLVGSFGSWTLALAGLALALSL
jgi:hypothetical protein